MKRGKHSPLPWSSPISNYGRNVVGADGILICQVDGGYKVPTFKNLELILTACNNHHKLLKACKKAVFALNQIPNFTMYQNTKKEITSYKICSMLDKVIHNVEKQRGK